jgi:transcription termination factor Rho
MVMNKAGKQVEAGKHVIILLDSITRFAWAHNTE